MFFLKITYETNSLFQIFIDQHLENPHETNLTYFYQLFDVTVILSSILSRYLIIKTNVNEEYDIKCENIGRVAEYMSKNSHFR
jgi:hypothetical protein